MLPDGVRPNVPKKRGGITYSLSKGKKGKPPNPLTTALKALGMYGKRGEEKTIPEAYLRANTEDRISLLQGLIDTDGTVSKTGQVSYTTCSEELSRNVVELVRSLGGIATATSRITTCLYKGELRHGARSYTVFISLPKTPLATLPRKQNRIAPQLQNVRRCFKSVEDDGIEECVCISVDSYDGLYVTDDYILTHNTTCAHALARELYGEDWRSYTLDTNASADRGIEVVRGRIKEFARSTPLDQKFNIVFLDECDALTADAQSALRRPIEDYSKVTRFVLSCNYPNRIIKPIRSRCVIYKFQPLADETVADALAIVCDAEKVEYSKSALLTIARRAKGAMRDALTMAQDVATLGAITDDAVAEADHSEVYGEVLGFVAKDNIMGAEDAILRALRKGLDPDEAISGFYETIRESGLPEKVKHKVLNELGLVQSRIVEGGTPEIQLRCYVRYLASLKG